MGGLDAVVPKLHSYSVDTNCSLISTILQDNKSTNKRKIEAKGKKKLKMENVERRKHEAAQRKCLESRFPSHVFFRLCQSYGIPDCDMLPLSSFRYRVHRNYSSAVLSLYHNGEEESHELD